MMNKHFTIVGAGPTGLTLAFILKYYGNSVTVLERESTPGGCHRVVRVDEKFTEHGPRIYTSGSKTFHYFLQKVGLDHRKYFTPYKAQVSEPLKDSMKYFSAADILRVVSAYTSFLANSEYGSDMVVRQLNLSTDALFYVDKMCRLTDGAGADRYTVNSFIRLIDQKFTETIQQPLYANDNGWVSDLVQRLKINGVQFLFSKEVQKIKKNDGYIVVTKEGNEFTTDEIIFCIPTDALENILFNSRDIQNVFGPLRNLKTFNQHCLYETYLSVTLHWMSAVKLPTMWGNGLGEWNIAWITLTDYMLTEPGSIVSACITKCDTKSTFNGKTAHECSAEDLKAELLRQLSPLIGHTRKPDFTILSPEVYRENNKWHTRDNAYMRTNYAGPGRPGEPVDDNRIYSVGCHNEHSTYRFTSVEAAVQNAFYWAHRHLPGAKQTFPIKEAWALSALLKYSIVLMIIFYLVHKNIRLI